MKKYLCLLLSVVLIVSSFFINPTRVEAGIYSFLFGDVDHDGDINVHDAATLGKYLEDVVDFTEEEYILADVNGDGYVDDDDLSDLYEAIYNGNKYSLPIYSILKDTGYCGSKVKYLISNDGDLIIFGSGEMYDYEDVDDIPWYDYRDSIEYISVKEDVTKIGENAFFGCDEANYISLPFGLKTIGEYAFESTGVDSIYIPYTVNSIALNAFDSFALEDIDVDEDNNYYSSLNGVLYNKNRTKLLVYPYGKKSTSFTVPGTVVTIGEYAISNNNLENLYLDSSLKTIEMSAIWGDGIAELTIPASVNSIGAYALSGLDNLKKITFLSKDCSIDDYVEIPTQATIYGYEGSTSKKYADLYGYHFVSLGNQPTVKPTTRKKQNILVYGSPSKVYAYNKLHLDVETTGNGNLSYKSSNTSIATVSAYGVITPKGYGIVKITITASQTSKYNKATREIIINVLPKKAGRLKVSSPKKNVLKISWKKDSKASGYVLQISKSKKFKKTLQKSFSRSKKSIKVKFSNQSKKKYFVRMRLFKKTNGINYFGKWSSVVSKKIK